MDGAASPKAANVPSLMRRVCLPPPLGPAVVVDEAEDDGGGELGGGGGWLARQSRATTPDAMSNCSSCVEPSVTASLERVGGGERDDVAPGPGH